MADYTDAVAAGRYPGSGSAFYIDKPQFMYSRAWNMLLFHSDCKQKLEISYDIFVGRCGCRSGICQDVYQVSPDRGGT